MSPRGSLGSRRYQYLSVMFCILVFCIESSLTMSRVFGKMVPCPGRPRRALRYHPIRSLR